MFGMEVLNVLFLEPDAALAVRAKTSSSQLHGGLSQPGKREMNYVVHV
jgi:hypothetical protein